MTKKIIYGSCIAGWINDFILEKKSSGYRYDNEAKWMRMFDSYWHRHGYGQEGLSQENVSEWIEKRESEGMKCLASRISVIRQFSMYLNGLGIKSYIPPLNVRYAKAVIHMPTDEEIAELFVGIDSYSPQKGSVDTRRIASEYPVIFRLIYLNGLRASETCLLPMDSVDLENGILYIIDGKGNRDRLIYLSEDMLTLCKDSCTEFSPLKGFVSCNVFI